MTNRNILITSAGRRVSLVKQFMAACGSLMPEAKVYAADAHPELSAACQVAHDCFTVPSLSNTDYFSALLKICKDNAIGMVIPTIDTELVILAENKTKFEQEGIHCIVSDAAFIGMCRDKSATADFFADKGINVPQYYNKHNIKFPVFARLRNGSSSKGILQADSIDDIPLSVWNNRNYIFSEYLSPLVYKEYTIDMYFSRDHVLKCLVPRLRIETRGGEVSKSKTAKNHLVDYLKQRFDFLPHAAGCINMQLFYNETEAVIYGIEINARFGGGYPLSYHAGADYPSMLIREYFLDQHIDYSDNWKDDLLMLRYDDEIIVQH